MQKPRGTKDIFGSQSQVQDFVFKTLVKISKTFDFQQITTPIFEFDTVFTRSMGLTSDVVSKEMYHFRDRSDRKLVLRPEGTAGVVRAIVENKLYAQPLPLKLFYLGPMFRYENPQQGRQRQFTQYGVELLGAKSPYLDAEMILMAATILDAFKIDYVLKINSLGDEATRKTWLDALGAYFQRHQAELEPKSRLRLAKNPARILDDKDEMNKEFVKTAPPISKFYSPAAKDYLTKVSSFLKTMGLQFTIDNNLVRGFDYYTDIVFEFVSSKKLKVAQGTIIGGGRYDHLITQFGGPDLSGVGFALGVERLIVELGASHQSNLEFQPDVYVVNIDSKTTSLALSITYLLRRAGVHVAWNHFPKHLKKGLEKADKTGAKIKIIVGPEELATETITIKTDSQQQTVKVTALITTIKAILEQKEAQPNEDNQ